MMLEGQAVTGALRTNPMSRTACVRGTRGERPVSASVVADPTSVEDGFRHEAFFYGGEREFVAGASAFLRQGVEAAEPALVVVSARKIDLLRRQLGADAHQVRFADMAEVGTNPARIIPAWADFVHDHAGRRLRGIGEPIWAERSSAEVVECQRHESLLNVAFAESPGFILMCPYDTAVLDADVVDEARRSHPFISHPDGPRTSVDYLGTEELAGPFSTALPDPPSSAIEIVFQISALSGLRSLVWREAMAVGLGEERAGDAVTAVSEIAANSVRHGGGHGLLRIWLTTDVFICEVSDHGRIEEALVGRYRPGPTSPGGRGLWMVNQLCELVQVRTFPTGTTVRLHLRRQAD